MMTSILNNNQISFKELEQKNFIFVCGLGQEIARIILENRDNRIAEERDTEKYRDKGKRRTSIKTIFGSVPYSRRVYRTVTENGETEYVYLLDEELQMDKIGMISTNLAEKIAMLVTESPYRVTADTISETCGQSISHGGVWNLIQKLGERIDEEENQCVKEMENDRSRGKKVISTLFEEMDGAWLRMQGSHHEKQPKQEMKVFTMYEGWDKEKEEEKRSTLVGKKVLAGMESNEEFHKKREAFIRREYNADEIGQRILNGDGGGWIKDEYDPDVMYQLDRYHIYQEILRKIRDEKARKDIRELFEEEKMEEMLAYIEMYADSIANNNEEDNREKKARELYRYLNNKEGLLPYHKRGIEIHEPPEGVIYKEMGVQENQNCTLITLRMKPRRIRWSEKGAGNMAKVLCRKENKELIDTIDRYTDGLIFAMQMEEVIETLSAAKAPKKDGKGNPYVDICNFEIPLFEALQTESRKMFKRAMM